MQCHFNKTLLWHAIAPRITRHYYSIHFIAFGVNNYTWFVCAIIHQTRNKNITRFWNARAAWHVHFQHRVLRGADGKRQMQCITCYYRICSHFFSRACSAWSTIPLRYSSSNATVFFPFPPPARENPPIPFYQWTSFNFNKHRKHYSPISAARNVRLDGWPLCINFELCRKILLWSTAKR